MDQPQLNSTTEVNGVSPEDPPFFTFMRAIFWQNIEKALEVLDGPAFDYKLQDGHLFRELHCGRLSLADTLLVYHKLVKNAGR